jgi:hypothetical protein
LAAVQKVREAAARIKCSNQMRQLGIAAHNCNDKAGRLPPAQGWFPGDMPSPGAGWGGVFFHLLPYIEQGNLYKSAVATGPNPFGQNPAPYYSSTAGVGTPSFVGAKILKGFQCPSDPSVPSGTYTDLLFHRPWATSSYAGNFVVFGVLPNPVQYNFVKNYQGTSSIPRSFSDGTSNTILFAERYAVCESVSLDLPRACLWDFWLPPSSPTGAYLFGGIGHDYFPYFALPTWNGTPIGPDSRFQVRPTPGNCDPSRASTAHPGGMQVTLADGSVRTLSSGMSGTTWWAAVTPAGGEVLGSDW